MTPDHLRIGLANKRLGLPAHGWPFVHRTVAEVRADNRNTLAQPADDLRNERASGLKLVHNGDIDNAIT